MRLQSVERRLAATLMLVASPIAVLLHGGCSDLEAVLVSDDAGADVSTDRLTGGCPTPRPPEGVYRYRTAQGLTVVETLVLGDASVPINVGPDFKGTVRHTPTGYTVLFDLGDNHSSTLEMEESAAGVAVSGWDEFVYGTNTLVNCGPPSSAWNPCDRSATVWPIGCTGTNTVVDGGFNVVGTHRLAGETSVVIDGVTVAAYQYVDSRSIQGTQEGTQDLEWWLSKESGLVLRAIFSSRVSSPSPIGGTATYSGNLDFRLSSLTPAPLP